jgi:hypothetical protein
MRITNERFTRTMPHKAPTKGGGPAERGVEREKNLMSLLAR